MPAFRRVDDVHIRLATPAGFVDAATIFPSFLEVYRREQEVLAVYLDACHLTRACKNELPDPFVEVLTPERDSPMRRVEPDFFEACKLEVESNIRGCGVRPEEAESMPAREGLPLPPLATFADGTGWFACCTLRYKEDCLPGFGEGIAQTGTRDASDEARSGGDAFTRKPLVPCLTGNIVFLLRRLPVIVNIHRSVDKLRPMESFEWMRTTTEGYCHELLPLNGIAL